MVLSFFSSQVLLLLVPLVSGTRCLDNDGKPVAWWFMYKMPELYSFAYADPSTALGRAAPLTMFERAMNDTKNPVALVRTLYSIAEDRNAPYNGTTADAPSYLLYNDEPFQGIASSSFGHTKGVLAAGGEARSGLWIVHSTPKFPATSGRAEFYFPESEIKYGQTFLCVSLDSAAQVDAVGRQLQLTRPFIYHATNLFKSAAATERAGTYPELAKVLRGEWRDETGEAVAMQLGNGTAATTFTSLAKNKEWNDDLWEGLVAPHYNSGFLVESWIRGDRLGKYCPNAKTKKKPFEVVDARIMGVSLRDGSNHTWTETQDHAKWAVSLDSSYVLCVGDINRMSSQRKRGGGAVCFVNKELCFGLYNTILASDTCGKGADDDDDDEDVSDDVSV